MNELETEKYLAESNKLAPAHELPRQLKALQEQMKKALKSGLYKQNRGISVNQALVLEALNGNGNEGINAGQLAHKLLLDNATITRVVKQLMGQRLVFRQAGVDLRQVEVRLTAKGQLVSDEIAEMVRDSQQTLVKKLDEDELVLLKTLLSKLLV